MFDFNTPMMVQYSTLKQQYKDCLLFFRLGDFYELFLEDAHIGAKILGITLTARPRGKDGDIPMAGVPYHSADSYIAKLVKAGYKVAICEQVSLPSTRNIVDRAVVRIITPGTLLDDKHLEQRENNFVFCISEHKGKLGLVISDLSTGLMQLTEFEKAEAHERLRLELKRFMPSECIIHPKSFDKAAWKTVLDNHTATTVFPFYNWPKIISNRDEIITTHFEVNNLSTLHLKSDQAQTHALAALLEYFKSTQQHRLEHLRKFSFLQSDRYLTLDPATWENLEVFTSLQRDPSHTLIGVLDQTKTALGGRLLRSWLKHPLRDPDSLEKRLDALEFFINHQPLLNKIRNHLETISDLERQLSRLSVGLGNPRDCLGLSQGISQGLVLAELLDSADIPVWLSTQLKKIDVDLAALAHQVAETITPRPPIDIKKGDVIRPGIYPQLDLLRDKIKQSQDWILRFEESERERTGISSLKVKFNKVFGYYIEISNANLNKVPTEYLRKQTLVSSERFMTEELKIHEEIIISSQEEIRVLETEYFNELVSTILKSTEPIQKLARVIAHIDVITNLAFVSAHNRYVRPRFHDEGGISIKEGRHPVVEKALSNPFVPNDVTLNNHSHQLIVLTGPNMGGKSVYMRQVALITLIAQIGCFVPATEATLPLVDRLFVRSGAADAITSGLSTFMMEMVETAYILRHATKDSLVIMDEIGRGTSTYDGISIAWAVADYLITHLHTKTLFATHYLELQDLEAAFPELVKNYHVTVAKEQGQTVFLHQIQPGVADQSFGIEVAQLAGVPQSIITKAQEKLNTLHLKEGNKVKTTEPTSSAPKANDSLIAALQNLDLARTTPLEALNWLAIKQAETRE